MKRFLPPGLAILLLLGHPIVIDADNQTAGPLPEDDRPNWVIGVATLLPKGLSQENRYLTHSIPLLIIERLEIVPTHFFSAGELLGQQRARVVREKRARAKELSTLRRERDELFFSHLAGSVRENKLSSYERRILELVDHLNYLEELDPREIVFPESKPVHFNIGGESGSLLPAPAFSPLRMAKREELDLLIWGRIEEVQDYLYIELGALDTALGREVFSFKDAAVREDLHQSIDAIVADLVPVVWGRDWSALRIEVEPQDSRVYLDGEYIAEGDVFLEYLLPGRREVRVVHAGYMESMAEVELVPYETTEYRVRLIEKVPEMVRIDSKPGKVNVYQGAMWLGKTPLEIIRPESTTRLLLRSEESDDFSFYLDKNSPNKLSFSIPENLDPQSLQKKRRNDFYASFGLFALSVPLPFYFWAMYNDYYLITKNAANAAKEAEALGLSAEAQRLNAEAWRLYADHNNYYTAFWGTLSVSVSLFVNAVITVLRYTASADRM